MKRFRSGITYPPSQLHTFDELIDSKQQFLKHIFPPLARIPLSPLPLLSGELGRILLYRSIESSAIDSGPVPGTGTLPLSLSHTLLIIPSTLLLVYAGVKGLVN
jgi:hypothetical protein